MNQHRGVGPWGEFHAQVQELRRFSDKFYQYFRITIVKFNELLSLLEQRIAKENTNYRSSISAEERQAVCLR